uniref:Putative trypsin zeta-like protein n=1 Tax=Haematobia irritans TaxID=7368 RepID=A0A1L8ECN5_HAEIR
MHFGLVLLISLLAFGHTLPLEESVEGYLEGSRIVGGQPVDITSYGYQISLRKRSIFSPQSAYRHICGGSIYSESIVITAAHCVIGAVPGEFMVVAGTSFRTGGDGVMVPVKEILMHESYDPPTTNYDVAILMLSTPLPLNGYNIRAIDLIDSEPLPGTETAITGWGALVQGGASPHHLFVVKVPVVSREQCNADYEGRITEQMLCAGDRDQGGKDACQGDSGGPLAIRNKLAGIVSWGEGCAQPGYPGIYSNVWNLRDWILEKVNQQNGRKEFFDFL